MEEGERKLCLVELPLELGEKTPLQVQMELMEEMEDREALAAEVVLEVMADTVLCLPLILIQQKMEVSAELVVMEAAAAVEDREGASMLVAAIIQEREVQEVLAALEGEAVAVEVLVILTQEIGAVRAEQEVMAEVEGVAVAAVAAVAVPLVALD